MWKVYEPLWRLTSVKAEWTWNRIYQEIYERATLLVKEDMCMKYYNVRKPLYLETDASGVGLGVELLQVRDNLNCRYNKVHDNAMLQPITFCLVEPFHCRPVTQQYRKRGKGSSAWVWEVPPLLHCTWSNVITDHKPLVAIMGKDVATLSQCLQCIVLCTI